MIDELSAFLVKHSNWALKNHILQKKFFHKFFQQKFDLVRIDKFSAFSFTSK
jgi:hypothetical protein